MSARLVIALAMALLLPTAADAQRVATASSTSVKPRTATVVTRPPDKSSQSSATGASPPAVIDIPRSALPHDDPAFLAAWESRAALLEQLQTKKELLDKERLAAFAQLLRETAAMQGHYLVTQQPLGEDYGAYYMDLVLFVTKMKDPRSIPALAGATDVGARVSTTLAEFGDPAVDAVIARLSNPLLETSSIYTLGKFLQGRRLGKSNLSDAAVAKIRAALLSVVLRNPSSAARRNVLEAFAWLPPDAELLRVLRANANEPAAQRLLKEWSAQGRVP